MLNLAKRDTAVHTSGQPQPPHGQCRKDVHLIEEARVRWTASDGTCAEPTAGGASLIDGSY
jgi:hypothetical protein